MTSGRHISLPEWDLERELGIVAVRIDPIACAPGLRSQLDDTRIPLLGVMGALMSAR